MYLKRPDIYTRLGASKLTKVILSFQGIIMCIGVLTCVISVDITGAPLIMPFCYGRTLDFSDVYNDYRNMNKHQDSSRLLIPSLIVLALQSFLFLEVGMYIILYKRFKEDDAKMKGTISAHHLKKRFRKNTINLTGQIFGFVLESIYFLGAIVLIYMRYIGIPMYTYIGLSSHTFVVIAMFLASPELRRHYLIFDVLK